jgi:hypothetical protein
MPKQTKAKPTTIALPSFGDFVKSVTSTVKAVNRTVDKVPVVGSVKKGAVVIVKGVGDVAKGAVKGAKVAVGVKAPKKAAAKPKAAKKPTKAVAAAKPKAKKPAKKA